jgi:hypothetical protein
MAVRTRRRKRYLGGSRSAIDAEQVRLTAVKANVQFAELFGVGPVPVVRGS